MGLANRVCRIRATRCRGRSRSRTSSPRSRRQCLRNDRRSGYEQWDLDWTRRP